MEQRAEPCRAHPGCVAIRAYEGDKLIWESHMHASAGVETRINLDYPIVKDRGVDVRWRIPNPAEIAALGWDHETVMSVARAAVELELDTAGKIAADLGVSPSDLETGTGAE